MGLLDGGMAAAFGQIFGGVYLDGFRHPITLAKQIGGRLTLTEGAATPMKFQQDAVTWKMRQTEGFTERDARFLILTTSCPALTTADEITALGQRWSIEGPLVQDPARAYWDVHARPTEPPAA